MGSVRPSTSRVMPLCLSKYGDRSYCTYSSAISTSGSGSGVPVTSFKRFKSLEKKSFLFFPKPALIEQSAGGEASLAMLSSLVSNRAVLSAASSNTQGRGVPAYRPRPFSLPFPFLLQLAGRTRQLQSEEADCRGVRRF